VNELVTRLPDFQALYGSESQDTMAEWLRRQIRISIAICFPLGAQVQILLVSSFSTFFSSVSRTIFPSITASVSIKLSHDPHGPRLGSGQSLEK
jgi:hypothetical protein